MSTLAVAPPRAVVATAEPVVTAPASPLTVEHLRQLAEARARGAKVRHAASVATFGGWSLAVFAGLTFAFGLLSVTGWAMGIGLAVAAAGEFRGAARLRRLDPLAPRHLAWNQLFLAGLLIAYAGWGVWSSLYGPDPLAGSAAASPEVAQLIASFGSLVRTISAFAYGGVALIAVGAQGGTAWYYFSRERHLRTYLSATPAWVLDLQRSGAPV